MASLISPELALVDPLLRTDALAALPHVEPFDFLRFREPAPAAVHTRRPPLALAAVVYTASAAARVPGYATVMQIPGWTSYVYKIRSNQSPGSA